MGMPPAAMSAHHPAEDRVEDQPGEDGASKRAVDQGHFGLGPQHFVAQCGAGAEFPAASANITRQVAASQPIPSGEVSGLMLSTNVTTACALMYDPASVARRWSSEWAAYPLSSLRVYHSTGVDRLASGFALAIPDRIAPG
jgi:hypothetical protein